MDYLWFVKKLMKYCVWFGTCKKWFLIRDPQSLNLIPGVSSHLTVVTLQDDVVANFRLQRLGSLWQRLSQSLQISMDRLCRLTANLQNQKHKIQSNIFENIFFEAADHQIRTRTRELYWNSYFYSCNYEKTSLAVHFTK